MLEGCIQLPALPSLPGLPGACLAGMKAWLDRVQGPWSHIEIMGTLGPLGTGAPFPRELAKGNHSHYALY